MNSSIQDIDAGALRGGAAMTNLQCKVAEIRLTRVNWQSYLQGQMINSEQFNFISQLDNATSTESRNHVINEYRDSLAKIFIALLNRISKEQTLQYLLSMLDDIFQEDKSRVELFRNYFDDKNENIWNHFFNFLQRSEMLGVYQISKIITKLACWSSKLMDDDSLQYFLDWLQANLQKKHNEYLQTVARNLQMLLRVNIYRVAFVTQHGVNTLIKVLKDKETTCELQYQLIFCLWCLSFNPDLVQDMIKDPTLVPTVSDVFCDAEREKVLRISMAFLRSILEKLENTQQQQLLRDCALCLVQCKTLKRLDLLAQKDYSHDPEMTDDVKFLQETLKTSVHDVSSMEEYTTELTSGRLEWSPVHKSEKFWRENASNFTEKNYELLKMLIYLLENSREPLILSVAAHDVGEFVRHYPRGKQVIDNLGGKQLVMSLLQHKDAAVRYNALLSLQKIMVHNWEYLGKQLDSSAQVQKIIAANGNGRAK